MELETGTYMFMALDKRGEAMKLGGGDNEEAGGIGEEGGGGRGGWWMWCGGSFGGLGVWGGGLGGVCEVPHLPKGKTLGRPAIYDFPCTGKGPFVGQGVWGLLIFWSAAWTLNLVEAF